jgi:hypothetical protein
LYCCWLLQGLEAFFCQELGVRSTNVDDLKVGAEATAAHTMRPEPLYMYGIHVVQFESTGCATTGLHVLPVGASRTAASMSAWCNKQHQGKTGCLGSDEIAWSRNLVCEPPSRTVSHLSG